MPVFNANWYLTNNPDVAAAVAAGLLTAEEHFELYGKFENRSPSPFFDPNLYLAANPDVAAAIEAGDFSSAFQHFAMYGRDEGRSASLFFNPDVYLANNPDVATAIEAGEFSSAFDHFLAYGQNEPRATSQFFDLAGYLEANPDVAAAVRAGVITAFDHFILYGFQEGRDLGNGISLAQFASDPVAQATIQSGDVEALMQRVAEVAPFLATYEPPAGYTIPSNQPIPQDFVQVGDNYLVVPEGVEVPDGTDLPPAFGPDEEPQEPGNPDPVPQTFTLTTGTDSFTGSATNDTFNGVIGGNAPTFNATDALDGGAGTDTLNIAATGAVDLPDARIRNIENVNVSLTAVTGSISLAGFTGVEKLTLTGTSAATGGFPPGGTPLFVRDFADSGVSVIDVSAITSSLLNGTEGVAVYDTNANQDIIFTGSALTDWVYIGDGNNNITTGGGNDFVDVGDGDNTITTGDGDDSVNVGIGSNTINLGNGANTLLVESDGDVETLDGNNTITGGSDVDTIDITGDGDNTITTAAGNDVVLINGDGDNIIDVGSGDNSVSIASTAGGNNVITAGDGSNVVAISGAGDNTVTTGASADAIILAAEATGDNIITAGDGNDSITVLGVGGDDPNLNAADSLDGGAGTDTLYLVAASGVIGAASNAARVSNVENVIVTLSASTGVLNLENYTGVDNLTLTGTIGDDIGVWGTPLMVRGLANSGVSVIDTTLVTGNVGGVAVFDPSANQDITVTTGALADAVYLGNGDNVITTGAGNNSVNVGDGDNVITTGEGDDSVNVGTGSNTINLGDGANALLVSGDDDTLTLDGNNTITGGSGVDVIDIAGDGSNTITTAGGADTILIRGDGDNTITAGEGNDIIVVTADAEGENVIIGGSGVDSFTLSGGSNLLVFNTGDTGLTDETVDTVFGFTSGVDAFSFSGPAGNTDNYAENDTILASLSAALTAANDTFDGTVQYFLQDAIGGSFLFVDMDLNGAADSSVFLSGVSTTGFAATDIVTSPLLV